MKKLLLILFISVGASGCVTASPSFVKNGVQHYEATCNGTARSMADCYKKAAQICGGDFKEFSQEGDRFKRSMVFTCS